jgi:hypothetical protein
LELVHTERQRGFGKVAWRAWSQAETLFWRRGPPCLHDDLDLQQRVQLRTCSLKALESQDREKPVLCGFGAGVGHF